MTNIDFSNKRLLTTKEASIYLDGAVKESTLRNWRCEQNYQGPNWYKIGREVRYRIEDLDQYILNCKQQVA